MPIMDALLLCHVSWVIGIESGSKKIGSSQRYEVEKLAQYRWDIRYHAMSLFMPYLFAFDKLNLDPKGLVFARNMRSRSWPNIDGTYGISN